ncbi:MAG: nuclear transport factor 2 family protein [Ramlibacter sp.]|nr:nuclear transport factor 2 family protein [Ramlibacter sp.]
MNRHDFAAFRHSLSNQLAGSWPIPTPRRNAVNPEAFADRYIALWNEPDPVQREASIAALWLPDGSHHVRTQQAQGHEALARRVTGAYEKNVRDLGFCFRRAGAVQALHDSLMFHWHMVRPGQPQVEALGLEFLRLSADGRIATDYQFILPTPAAS